jgi:hypothetical protein
LSQQCTVPTNPPISQNTHYTLFPKSSAEEVSHNAEFPTPYRDQQSQSGTARPAGRSGSNERGKSYPKDVRGEQVTTTVGSTPRPAFGRSISAPQAPVSGSEGKKAEVTTDSSSHLSRLGQAFVKIGYGQYRTCQNFIDNYPEIRKEALGNFQLEAVRLEQEGKFSMVENCVQQLLLLRNCSFKSDEECEDFFDRMKKRDPATLESFHGNFDKTLKALKAKAASAGPIQHVRSEPQSLGSTNRGSTQVPAEVRHAPEPNRHNSAENDLPASLRRLSIRDSRPKLSSVAEHPGPDLQSDTNSQAGDVSILDAAELDIRGNGGDHEELDHRYYRRPDGKKFFVVGRVFAMLWHEGAGDKKGGHLSQAEPFNVQRNSKKKGKYNEEVFSHIRRMAVVKARHGYCWCVPINTYNYQGVAKKGFSPEDRRAHAIIHMDNTKPAIHPAEKGMMFKSPITVSAANSEQKLHYMSRINFGKVYSVEWNVKVMNVGKVHRDSMFNFEGYWRNEATNP